MSERANERTSKRANERTSERANERMGVGKAREGKGRQGKATCLLVLLFARSLVCVREPPRLGAAVLSTPVDLDFELNLIDR